MPLCTGGEEHPCLKPFLTSMLSVLVLSTLTWTFIPSWNKLVIFSIAGGTPFFCSILHRAFLDTELYAFFRSTNRIYVQWVLMSLVFSIIWRTANIISTHPDLYESHIVIPGVHSLQWTVNVLVWFLQKSCQLHQVGLFPSICHKVWNPLSASFATLATQSSLAALTVTFTALWCLQKLVPPAPPVPTPRRRNQRTGEKKKSSCPMLHTVLPCVTMFYEQTNERIGNEGRTNVEWTSKHLACTHNIIIQCFAKNYATSIKMSLLRLADSSTSWQNEFIFFEVNETKFHHPWLSRCQWSPG